MVARSSSVWVIARSNPSQVPSLLIHVGKLPAVMQAVKRSAHVVPEVDLKECTLHSPPQKENKIEPTLALRPREDITRSPGRIKGHVSDKNFKKKEGIKLLLAQKYLLQYLDIIHLQPLLTVVCIYIDESPLTMSCVFTHNSPCSCALFLLVSARSHGAIVTANCIKNSHKMVLYLAMMG